VAWFTLLDGDYDHHVPESACAWVDSQFCDETPHQRRTNVRLFVALARKLRDIRRRVHADTEAAEKKRLAAENKTGEG